MIPVLLAVAFITLAERKVLRITGFRQGPNKVSLQGILQPIGDALKLANKSHNEMSNYHLVVYYLSVIIIIFCSVMIWSCLSLPNPIIGWKFSMLTIIIIIAISSIKAIISGWRTYGKYPLIGSMRTVSQIISYESVIYLCLLTVIWIVKSFSIEEIFCQDIKIILTVIPLSMIIWMPSVIAELNRTPYDFSEGERELVRGFNTEFGSRSFTLIFLREYRNIIFFIIITTFIFMITDLWITNIIIFSIINFWIIWVRRTLPRMRFDKFIEKAWKFYIPLITCFVVLNMSSI